MYVINARNPQLALPKAIRFLNETGIPRMSRNGPVLISKEPVTTVYTHPMERVIFWPERDANPFLHLYESLWMLSGRNDVAPLLKFAKNYKNYSDDGATIHDSYGYRWRKMFGMDQLRVVADRLKKDPDDRRSVVQMWDAEEDLDSPSKAVPCNMIITFQRDHRGALDMVVFNRSNDIIWGCYGANVVHFSYLLEYMADAIGCPMGTYTQISVNWHAYLETFEPVRHMTREYDPYTLNNVHPIPMAQGFFSLDSLIKEIMTDVDTQFMRPYSSTGSPWANMVQKMLRAHHIFSNKAAPEKYIEALAILSDEDPSIDWIAAGTQWIQRRRTVWENKMGGEK